VLRPTITEIEVSELEGTRDDPRSAKVMIQVNLTIIRTQRVVLLLNELSTERPAAYSFDAAPREADTNSLAFAIYEVKAGEYLVRVQVDGAESLLNVDTDPDSPTFEQYISPTVLIS
jgi:hypothetical protein